MQKIFIAYLINPICAECSHFYYGMCMRTKFNENENEI